jgi:UDP-N-acetyl-D-glucosamine/UDP-N-acetyl-D-galactosamine dehydrogenase
VVGLGYVGLPLSLAFARELPTTGFDVDESRVNQLSDGSDRNREVSDKEISSSGVTWTTDPSCIDDAEFIVVTVPTPVTDNHEPDLSLLESASKAIGVQLSGRSEGLSAPIIVFESTTYPGCTEEFCGPIIERESDLVSGEGFFLGYSPERTNFGDEEHTLETVIKVVSGQTPEVAQVVSDTYGRIAKAGTYMAASIQTAEASKVIENVQRDLNIALFNEMSVIFARMDIRSSDVFDAAATKWNFHRYRPGLVGGHCIPVDPYYLTYRAKQLGIDSKTVLAGREVNERMTGYVHDSTIRLIAESGTTVGDAAVLVLGVAFKPNIADIRNSKILDLIELFKESTGRVIVHDSIADLTKTKIDPSAIVDSSNSLSVTGFDAMVIGAAHADIMRDIDNWLSKLKPDGVLIDVEGAVAPKMLKNHQGITHWQL